MALLIGSQIFSLSARPNPPSPTSTWCGSSGVTRRSRHLSRPPKRRSRPDPPGRRGSRGRVEGGGLRGCPRERAVFVGVVWYTSCWPCTTSKQKQSLATVIQRKRERRQRYRLQKASRVGFDLAFCILLFSLYTLKFKDFNQVFQVSLDLSFSKFR